MIKYQHGRELSLARSQPEGVGGEVLAEVLLDEV